MPLHLESSAVGSGEETGGTWHLWHCKEREWEGEEVKNKCSARGQICGREDSIQWEEVQGRWRVRRQPHSIPDKTITHEVGGAGGVACGALVAIF